MKHNRRIMDDL